MLGYEINRLAIFILLISQEMILQQFIVNVCILKTFKITNAEIFVVVVVVMTLSFIAYTWAFLYYHITLFRYRFHFYSNKL